MAGECCLRHPSPPLAIPPPISRSRSLLLSRSPSLPLSRSLPLSLSFYNEPAPHRGVVLAVGAPLAARHRRNPVCPQTLALARRQSRAVRRLCAELPEH